MKFSIAIPAYKSNFLQQAIESVLAQTYQDYELIIVDDCSPNDLKSIVDRFFDDRIRYYRNAKNCGAINVVDNWNICLDYCSGDYIICMGDDDRLLPCCLDEYRKLINKYPGLDVYHAWTEIINENSKVYTIQAARPEWESAYSLIWHRWNGRIYQFIGDFLYDVSKLKENGGFYKMPLAWGSDDITAVRAAVTSGIANTQMPCFQYRMNELSISSIGNSKIKIESVILEKEWYVNFLNRKPTGNLDGLFWTMLTRNMESFFVSKIQGIIRSDMMYHLSNFFLWWNLSKKIGISHSQIIRIFLSSVLKSFFCNKNRK